MEDDGGLTTDWCGTTTRIIKLPDRPDGSVDYVAPKVSMRSAKGKVGGLATAPLHRADASPTVRVDLSVIAGGKALAKISLPAAKADGAVAPRPWRVPARRAARSCESAPRPSTASGNVSGRSWARLTVALSPAPELTRRPSH